MAKFFAGCVAVITIALVVWCYIKLGTITPASSTELQDTRTELARRIDELESKIDSLQSNVSHIGNDIDTLKKGQVVIFNEVRKDGETFWSKFFD